MNYDTIAEILEIIERGESNTVEFKEKPNEDVKKFLKTVAAFANGPGGMIIFGVNDNREIVGLEGDCFSICDQLTDLIVTEVVPQFLFTINPCTIEDKHILVLRINHGPQTPYYLKKEGVEDGTYIRINATTRRCSPETLKDLIIQGENRSYDMIEIVDSRITPEDDNLQQLCRYATEKSRRGITPTNLCNWGLLKKDGDLFIPSFGYTLLTDNPYRYARIECARFKGNDKSIFVDRKTCEGPLFDQIACAVRYVMDSIKTMVRLNDIRRIEEPEIPLEVIREAIVNAVVHRCYSITSSPIFISVYDESVEIVSPGLLPDGISVEEAVNGSRRHRNRALADFFIAMGLMEGWGSGLQRVFKLCYNYGLCRPTLKQIGEDLVLTLYRQGARPIDKDVVLPLTDLQKKLLEVVSDNCDLTLPEIAEILKVSVPTVSNSVKILKEMGRLSRSGSRKTGKWVVHKSV